MNKKADFRIESDEAGELQIPSEAYWGIQTARLRTHLSGLPPHPRLLEAMVLIKKAAAICNADSGRLDAAAAKAVGQAADEVLNGQWREQFIADPFLGGAGIALNVNVNEVLANRAAEILGSSPGSEATVRAEQVNLNQSTNDVFPSAARISILSSWRTLEPVLLDLERLLRRKSLEFDKVLKPGRTHLRDSLPITLGQEFNAYGASIERSYRRIAEAAHDLLELNIGGTVIGTGFNTTTGFASCILERLSHYSTLKLRQSEDYFRLSQSLADFVRFSSSLKELSIELTKLACDLRLLSSGPSAGFAEIDVSHSVFPSSFDSIEPIALLSESLNMVAFQVMSGDAAVALAGQAGQLELNAMTPLVAHNILQSIDLLRNALSVFNKGCVALVSANAAHCTNLFERSRSFAYALIAHIGESQAQALFQESLSTGKSMRELLMDQQLMDAATADRVLQYKSLTQPGISAAGEKSGER